MIRLSDFFIGEYPIAESFGENTPVYVARYNIQGYPGIRIKCPTNTLVLAAADGFVLETGFEEANKGKYVILQHNGFQTVYGHLNSILVQVDEKLVAGQLLGHSNRSGLTDIECIFFGVIPTDAAGHKTQDNGYNGYIDPMGDEIEWNAKNLKEPVVKSDVIDEMKLTSREYAVLNAQATNYKVLVSFLQQQTTFDEFLKEIGHAPVNLTLTPDDSAGGEAIISYLTEMANHFEELNGTIAQLESKVNETQPQAAVDEILRDIPNPVIKKKGFLSRWKQALLNFALTDL